MKFIQLPTNNGTRRFAGQAESTKNRMAAWCIVVAAIFAILSAPNGGWAQETSSPLEILQHAPKVRFDDPAPAAPTPAVRQPVTPPNRAPSRPYPNPYVAPRGPAPPVQPVGPAFTPYAGNSVRGDVAPQRNAYPEPAYRSGAVNTPTPRPILGPEDVPKKEKRGFFHGLINAIPFVGDDDEDEKQPTPAAEPKNDNDYNNLPPGAEPSIYRGYKPAPSEEPGDGPILLPPGATPLPRVLPADPEPSSPPIMTPFPRDGAPAVSPVEPAPAPVVTGPVLTVKRESDTTDTKTLPDAGVIESDTLAPDTPAEPANDTIDLDSKKPSISRQSAVEETPAPTPFPLEHSTTSVLIQDSRPAVDSPGISYDNSIGPKPDASATMLKPFDPTATPAAIATPALDVVTSLTVEQSDLGMPNPTYEQNTAVLSEFQDAVRKARTEDYASAAQQFRDYGLNHSSSGLAPRAFFLSIIFEKVKPQARENWDHLKRLFPESRYVDESKKRRPFLDESPTATASAGAEALPNETPQQAVVRLEKELTLGVGDTEKEPALRTNLALAYLKLEEYDRAYEVLRPAVEMSAGRPIEGAVLLAMGRILVARGETVQAISLYESVEQKYPTMIYKDSETAWNVGLAFEGAGRYTKARTIYNTIRQRWPQTTEAAWASKRLTDLASLRR